MSASDNDSYASDGQLSDSVGFNDAPLSMPITSTSSTDLSQTDLIQDVKELQAENIYLKSLNLSSKSSKEKSSLTKEDEAIAYAGARFTVTHELWVNRSTLELECPTNVNTLCPRCYNNLNKCEMVIIAEVYKSLPENLRAALSATNQQASFVKHFKHRLDSERVTSVSTACHIAGELFNINSSHFHSHSPCSGVTEVEVLLHNPTQPDKRYPLLAPLLFLNRDCSSPDIFKSKPLANLMIPQYLKAVLFGKSTLSGMIAMVATVLMFICGPDQMFSDKVIGPSGINWKQHFIQYKYTILQLPLAYHSTLLLWYDNIIFLTSTMSSGQANAESSDPVFDDINRLISQLDITEVRVPGQSLISSPPALSNGQTPGVGTTMAPMPDPDPDTPVTEVTDHRAPRSKGKKRVVRVRATHVPAN
ncbi:hypothetical protein F5148DRAFT_1151921 [Russula earlei]|uniref:Uncharacterized protein n=1 Tax=Russula earlei TaxID=71964 RepID=A0ACC0TYY9_9AGAM|nr:hypothetical protein F5148DRAFT_1151921 [Russula earlei]